MLRRPLLGVILELLSCLNFKGGGTCCERCGLGDFIPFGVLFNLGIPVDVFNIFEFCDFEDEVEDEDGRGDGTDGSPIVFGGAAKDPGRASLPAA